MNNDILNGQYSFDEFVTSKFVDKQQYWYASTMATIYDRQQQQAKVLITSQHKALVPTNEVLSLSMLQNSLHHKKRKVYTSCSATRQERQTFVPGQCTQKV